MRLKLPLTAIIAMLALTACNDQTMNDANDFSDYNIYLAAALESPTITRAPYTLTAPTINKPLHADVWASTTPKQFIDGDDDGSTKDGTIAMHTTANFQNAGPQLLNGLIYSKDNNDNPYDIYFSAMYPEGWTCDAEGKNATFDFDGWQDVMFAAQVTGRYGVTPWPTLYFRHLLTWLRIEIKAENNEVAEAWGAVKNIKIKSNSSVTIDLSKYTNNDLTSTPARLDEILSYDTPKTFNAYAADTENTTFAAANATGYKLLTDSYHHVAYLLCAPVVAPVTEIKEGTPVEVGEYQITIETEKRNPITPPVFLRRNESERFSGSTRGYQFTIQLTFKMGDNITISGIPYDWQTGGLGSGNLYE